jgi:amidase
LLDPIGAFVPHGHVGAAGTPTGPLAGLTFAAKDLFDLAGHVTGFGNPDWLASHAPAERTAPAIQRLLDAGARLVGKTVSDEFAYSLNGQNLHYGTPRNVAAPGRIPGGSSSGSAAAVAGRLVDFALGTDTGGSVRVPAALCGIYGFRPTHGRAPIEGVTPLAPSFDTVGWFARDAGILARVGRVLLKGEDESHAGPSGLILAEDGFSLADDAVVAVLRRALHPLEERFGTARAETIGGQEGLGHWMSCFRRLQAREIWATHGAWIETRRPRLGVEIAARLAWAKSVAAEPPGDDAERRETFARRLQALLADGALILLPTAPSIAPPLEMSEAEGQRFRDRTLSLTCIAGLARLPQVTIPAGWVEACPVALSLIGSRGADGRLVAAAQWLGRRLSAR